MWHSAERVLQAAVGRMELTGQALIGEARRVQVLSLGDAHALVALQGWADRQRDRASGGTGLESTDEDERAVARAAWLALENAVDRGAGAGAGPTTAPVYGSAASPTASAAPSNRRMESANSMSSPLAPPIPSPIASSDVEERAAHASTRRAWYSSSGVILGALLVLFAALAGGVFWYQRQQTRAFEEGLAAYQRGAREVARMAFARAAQDHPDDARPLIFLGRLSREENDLARARRFLEQAVTLDPGSATAQRELAAALLADGQPELARRFYVRAVELDPADRLAQGFLGCALFRLGRYEEARRWAARAGPGDWTACLNAPIPPPPPAGPSVPPR